MQESFRFQFEGKFPPIATDYDRGYSKKYRQKAARAIIKNKLREERLNYENSRDAIHSNE